MYKKYGFRKTFLFVILLIILTSCKYNNEQKNIDNELYKNIGDYINANRIDFYKLTDEQEIFYNKRLDFFMAVLNKDEKTKKEYYIYAMVK